MELLENIKYWLEISSVDLSDKDLIIDYSVKPIIYDVLEIGTFNRLKSKLNGIRKSNAHRSIYPNELIFKENKRNGWKGKDSIYYEGFEISLKIKSSGYGYSEDLLETVIDTFNLTLKQDNILDTYIFKVAVYNLNDDYFNTNQRTINIILLNTSDLKKVI